MREDDFCRNVSSDHHPVSLKFSTGFTNTVSRKKTVNPSARINWKKGDKHLYQNNVNIRSSEIDSRLEKTIYFGR